jgi:GNAT superfamily N-acetyltransferase
MTMRFRSIGMATDAMFAAFDGAVIDRGDYVVVSTPKNPTFFWGNHLVIPEAPRVSDIDPWTKLFERELPHSKHRAFFCDRTDGESFDPEPFCALGFIPDPTTVMRLDAPPDGPRAELVAVDTPERWSRVFDLLDACFTNGRDGYRAFLRIQVARYADMIASGFGHWYAIVEDDVPIATCGVFQHDLPCWRFQLVAVRPDRRHRGLASALVASVCREASNERRAPFIIGCVPGSQPERIYARLGFSPIERTIALVRPT